MKIGLFAVLVIGFAAASDARAAFINAPVPANAYIQFNGYDWAWAAPLPATFVGGGFDLSYQSQFGWRIPTAQELTLAPMATDFLFAGANVPFDGVDPVSGAMFQATNAAYTAAHSAGAVATPYFDTVYFHADWQDGLGQGQVWAGQPGSYSLADQLVIRGTPSAAVPEPASLTMLGIGVAGLMGLARRRARAARVAS